MKTLKNTILLLVIFFASILETQVKAQTYTTLGTNAASTGSYSTYLGYYAGYGTLDGQPYNTLLGSYAGYGADESIYNLVESTFIGYKSGYNLNFNSQTLVSGNILLGNCSGYNAAIDCDNIVVGIYAGNSSVLGLGNILEGAAVAKYSEMGSYNTLFGAYSGYYSTLQSYNLFLGFYSGYSSVSSGSIFIGKKSGYKSTGDNNLFLGNGAGRSVTADNKLIIHNEVNDEDPLIEGDFSEQTLTINGALGIGTTEPEQKLHVDGSVLIEDTLYVNTTIYANEIQVEDMSASNMNLGGSLYANEVRVKTNGNTADFVFDENYKLKDLSEVDKYVKAHKHLPGIASAEEMEKEGVDLAEMNKLLLQKVEELTLYVINIEKSNKQKDKEICELKQENVKSEQLQKELASMQSEFIAFKEMMLNQKQ